MQKENFDELFPGVFCRLFIALWEIGGDLKIEKVKDTGAIAKILYAVQKKEINTLTGNHSLTQKHPNVLLMTKSIL